MNDPKPLRNSPPTHYLVQDLDKGLRVDQVFLVEETNFNQTRNSKYFIQATLRDRSGSIKAIRWEADQELFSSFQPDDFVHVTGRVEEFQQRLQIIIDEIWRVDPGEVEFDAFLPVTAQDIGAMEKELLSLLDSVQNHHLKQLIAGFLADEEVLSGLRRAPAGKNLHHATVGGLLEHVLSLSRAASLLCQNYPQLNRDLLLAGAFLHDLGKIRELSYTTNFRYTDFGQLVGHIAIGISWTQEKARAIAGFPDALLHQVLHLIASHHGELELGAIKPPMTQEALALHHLDNLDAKLDIFKNVQKEQKLGSAGGENWSEWHQAMGRRLYFP